MAVVVPADIPEDLPTPDLVQFLDADPTPTFLIPIDPTKPVVFHVLISNGAFKAISDLESLLCEHSSSALQFRSWAQSAANWRKSYAFEGRSWTAFTIQGRWKVIRAGERMRSTSDGHVSARTTSPSPEDNARRLRDARSMDVRLESLQTMMEMSDVGVFEYDPSGILIRANESWYNLSLHPRVSKMQSDFSFMGLVYPPDIPLVISQWNKLSQGIPVTFEMRWKAPKREESGETEDGFKWVLSACVPVMDDSGSLVSIAGNTIDISAQKSIQQEAVKRAEALECARASERKFARFAELAPVAIYIFDIDKGMQYCNQKFFEMTGHPHMEPADVNWANVVFPDDLPIIADGWKTLLEDKRPAQTQFRLRKKWNSGDGKVREAWAQGQSYPECDEQGNVVSIFGALTDISRFKWAENVQRTRAHEALEAKRQQENFIDMTSHEMRNPLSAVIQCADSSIDSIKQISKLTSGIMIDKLDLNLEKVDEEIKTCLDALQTIISCSLHQKRVVDDILTLSKLDSALILITPIRMRPSLVVEEAVKMFELECSKENIELSFIEDSSLASLGADWVMLDPSRLLQVLINLLTNAIKFSRGRVVKKLTVSLGASQDTLPKVWKGITFDTTRPMAEHHLDTEEWGTGQKSVIWVTVQDTGCGLTPAEQGNLFTRFTQATPRTHVQYGGSGLGLFISKSLTELQNGRIGVCSEANVGSTFAFFVGTRIASPLQEDFAVESAHLGVERLISVAESVKAAHISVLIVEDNLVNQNVLSRQLQKAGCEVHVAGHGEEALGFLKSTKFWHTQIQTGLDLTIVLMDVEMPVMDGLTCARRIRELEHSGEIVGHIPILAVSANARSEQVRQAIDAGMDDSIAKPFRIPELLPKIELLAIKRK